VVTTQLENPSFIPHPHPTNTPYSPRIKVEKLTKVEMVEWKLKDIFYNSDEKYFPAHKFKEKNIFMAISEDISEGDDDIFPPK